MKTQTNTQKLFLEIQNKKSKRNASFDGALHILGIHQGTTHVKATVEKSGQADLEKVNS